MISRIMFLTLMTKRTPIFTMTDLFWKEVSGHILDGVWLAQFWSCCHQTCTLVMPKIYEETDYEYCHIRTLTFFQFEPLLSLLFGDKIQVENPLSKIPGTESVADFRFFQISEYFYLNKLNKMKTEISQYYMFKVMYK